MVIKKWKKKKGKLFKMQIRWCSTEPSTCVIVGIKERHGRTAIIYTHNSLHAILSPPLTLNLYTVCDCAYGAEKIKWL